MSTTPRLDQLFWDVGHQAYPRKIFDRTPRQNRHHPSERRPQGAAAALQPEV
ncbi:1-deoxy-D-xylulose-5-phosphate synthase N-terminal domain-containing protein [Escherichia coli]|uniref:1-deoxy-D-xylulose-5-phosphate synthase N-terminal domain-containing protein n=1 Tax=Escherichia coli TaxID=562 RepID=UPI0039DFC688